MAAIVSGLLDLLQWLAATAGNFFTWLGSTIVAVATWLLRLVEYPLVWLWNAGVDVLTWILSAVFWLLGHVLDLPLALLTLLVSFLPPMPPSLVGLAQQAIIPAYNIANRILPISEALFLGGLWFTFYGAMAVWRMVSFLRGGR